MNDPLHHIQKLQHQSRRHELDLPLGQRDYASTGTSLPRAGVGD